MNRFIYLKELKRNRKQLLLWGGIVTVFCTLIISFYPTFAGSTAQIQNTTKMVPKNLQNAIGMRMDQWSNILNFFSAYYGFHIMIFSSIFSIVVASTILAKEEGQGTADFLLTKPVTRNQVVASKLLAFLTLLAILHVVIIIVSNVLFHLIGKGNDFSLSNYLVMISYGVMQTLIFGSAGMFLSILVKRGKSFVGTGVGLVIGTFILEAISRIDSRINWLGYFSPFYYSDFAVYKIDYGFEWWRVLFLLGTSILFFVLTFVFYRRKDIYA